ncbi:activating signal cointegrator 1 complex subunit 2 [Teleopsis dalmanni]|uniref:activating signal cointegrator 1 complex subunit 2 n=1 Tax=Teleopsis dalmanni TaxID=139649 RepID=UPI0018CEC97E|nr:activating signal cointegrator 1 complex subunit 2 [Teleopsis dalmanni]
MPPQVEGDFTNPEGKPLNQLCFEIKNTDGDKKFIPALDEFWASEEFSSNYVSLVQPNGDIKKDVSLEEWKYHAECFREDMKFLLTCEHHKFWSYMVYKKDALNAILQFLQKATPFYIDFKKDEANDNIELYEENLSLVVRIIYRILTNKESDKYWITNEVHSDLIYKNFLISVPMLFDLLIAIGNADLDNVDLLRNIFKQLIEIQPKYKLDIVEALRYFSNAFQSIQTQTENEGFDGAGGGELDEGTETPYDDVVLYTLDCAYSLSVLLEVYPEARQFCYEHKLGQSIAHFYDNTIPYLYKNIFLINEAAKSLNWLNQARLEYLKAFRSISYAFVESVLINPNDSLSPSENFIALLTECLAEQMFVVDYQREYPVELDVDILKQACKDLDDFKASFVVKGYKKEAESSSIPTIGTNATYAQIQNTVSDNNYDASKNLSLNQKVTESVQNVKNVEKTVARDIDLEVTAVLDVLPDLDAGFIRVLLSRYDKSEDVIAAVLEGNLPPDLASVSTAEPIIPPDPQDKLYEQTGIKHFNVFDGDPYDVLTQDNPKCIIKQGKGFPNAPKNVGQLLDDKSGLEQIRHRYQEFTLVEEGPTDEYNDEYDDSYEALLEGESRLIKSNELRAGLANIQDDSESDDSETEEDSSNKETTIDQNKSKNFCENPEVIRARYEAQRQAKWNKKGSTPAQNTHNVVGAAKGQGQDKETLRNRNKKEVNKSSRANHNRKSGAAFKRSRGMVP